MSFQNFLSVRTPAAVTMETEPLFTECSCFQVSPGSEGGGSDPIGVLQRVGGRRQEEEEEEEEPGSGGGVRMKSSSL